MSLRPFRWLLREWCSRVGEAEDEVSGTGLSDYFLEFFQQQELAAAAPYSGIISAT